VELNKALAIVAVAALAALNVGSLSIGGFVDAIVLSLAVLALLQRTGLGENGIYVFLVAELSPLGLQAQWGLALLYQAFSLLLLAAVLRSFHAPKPFAEYRSDLSKMAVAVVVFLALTGIFYYAKPLDASDPQLFGFATGSGLVIFAAILMVWHYEIRLPKRGILTSKL